MPWGQFAEAWPRPMPVSSRYSRVCIIQYEEDQQVRSVVLTGNEKAFVAGADIGHIAKASIGDAYHLTDLTMRVQERLADLPKPTIAAISGYALGAGCEIALCCDFRIAAGNAVLGLPEITLDIIPGRQGRCFEPA
jgi:enoyl-CoA hydratase/carnithine racemase